MTSTQCSGSSGNEALRIGLQRVRAMFADALSRAGMHRLDETPERWRGMLTFNHGTDATTTHVTQVVISVDEEFPFACPKAIPQRRACAEATSGRVVADAYYDAGWGWHRDRDGAMCLFIEADHTRLPWADGNVLLDQARAWLANDAAGWPGDEPALDLERYLPSSPERRLVLYGDLGGCDGKVLRMRAERNDVLRISRAVAMSRRTQSKGAGRRKWASNGILIADAGDLTAPIRDWGSLLRAIGPDRETSLRRAHESGLRRTLITYRRRGVRGVLVVDLDISDDGTVTPKFIRAAPDDDETRRMRAHPGAIVLMDAQVAIVGVGAIGSVVADLLHRSGIGHLHLIDSDKVLPGNTTRHVVTNRGIGLPKSKAVADALTASRPQAGRVSWHSAHLRTVDETIHILSRFDLVVDASADSAATALLTTTANAGIGQLLSVCVLADGYAVRVDRAPTREQDEPLEGPVLPPPADIVYETGCGSPISTTPPAAVWEAAAVGARHAIKLLLAPDVVPAGEERVLDSERSPA